MKNKLKKMLFETVGYKFAKQKEVELDGEILGTLSINPTQMLFTPTHGEKIYSNLPEDLTEKILPHNKENSFSPYIKYITKENDALLMGISCWKGTYGDSVEENIFVTKIENENMEFANFIDYSYSNRPLKILELTKNHLFFDTDKMDLYQEEMSAFKQTMENMGPNGKTSEELIKDYKENLENKKFNLEDINNLERKLPQTTHLHELTFRK